MISLPYQLHLRQHPGDRLRISTRLRGTDGVGEGNARSHDGKCRRGVVGDPRLRLGRALPLAVPGFFYLFGPRRWMLAAKAGDGPSTGRRLGSGKRSDLSPRRAVKLVTALTDRADAALMRRQRGYNKGENMPGPLWHASGAPAG